MSHFNIPIFIPHLGCPFQCIFCNQRKITSVMQSVPAQEVKSIIEAAIKTIPEDAEVEVAFFGGSFTAIDTKLQQEYLTIVKPYLDKGLISGVRLSTRPDFIDQAKLDLLKAGGVTTIELGVQSLDDKVLLASGRGYKSEVVYEATQLIRQYNFQLGIQLMVGLPGDNLSADLETTKKTIAIKPDMVRIYPTLVIADTYLATMYKEGKYQPLSLAEAIKVCHYMFLHFQQNGIKVIRMGLHPEEEFSQSTTLLAGPFHPSFGELVQQEIYKEQANLLLQELFKTGKNVSQVKLFVNNKDLSKLIGNHRSNVCFWQQFFNLKDIIIIQDPDLPRDFIGIGTPAALAPQLFITRSNFIAAYLAK